MRGFVDDARDSLVGDSGESRDVVKGHRVWAWIRAGRHSGKGVRNRPGYQKRVVATRFNLDIGGGHSSVVIANKTIVFPPFHPMKIRSSRFLPFLVRLAATAVLASGF